MYFSSESGWANYGEGDFMGALVQSMQGLSYTPSLASTGSGAAYWPGDTSQDAQALAFLGFMTPAAAAAHVGTSGSQAADMSRATGAWSPPFKAAVLAFQQSKGLAADGWIGVNTRTGLGVAVAAKNATESPIAPPFVPPPPTPGPPSPLPAVVPPSPSPELGSGPKPQGMVDKFMAMPLWQQIAIGAGALAVVGGGVYYATK